MGNFMSLIHREVICVNTLQTNDWLILNSIIYEIYTTADFDKMRQKFLEQMKMLVDFDSADFYLASLDEEYKLTDPVTYHCEEDLCEVYDRIDYSRGIMYSGKNIVYRETDIISDEMRVKTEYYQKVYKPNNWHYSLQMIMAKDKKFLGVVTLYRNIGKDDFSHDDVFLVGYFKGSSGVSFMAAQAESYAVWREAYSIGCDGEVRAYETGA